MKKAEEIVEKLKDYSLANAAEKIPYFIEVSKTLSNEEWQEFWGELQKTENERAKLIFLMECFEHIQDNEKIEEYLKLVYHAHGISWRERNYLSWQINRRVFANAGVGNRTITELQYRIYHKNLQEFSSRFQGLEFIEERTKNLVFVTVQQFLNLTHGPTKTTLDRASVLKRKLGKNVIIINTAELLGGEMVMELLHYDTPGYFEELVEKETITYEEHVFPFVQFGKNMPNEVEALGFIQFVQKYKPEYIVNIGGNSLLVDTCSKMVPVLNINTVPSALACTEATMQVMARELTKGDEELLALIGKSRDQVIQGKFTWSLKTQTNHYTREQFEIPEDYFVITVIGGRLTTEIDREFVKMLEGVLCFGKALVLIIGKMDNYDDVCKENPLFGRRSLYAGLQEDVLAFLELSDLYVNPKRAGGGTSVIEAMYKGCPAVTLRGGDVALGAGDDFCVDTYEEMQKRILQYMTDKAYYQAMSQKARERAEIMLNSDGAFVDIIEEFENKISM